MEFYAGHDYHGCDPFSADLSQVNNYDFSFDSLDICVKNQEICDFYFDLKTVNQLANDLPDTITKIDERAFHKCENMTKINFPEGLKSIGFDAFIGCLGLEKVTLPSTIEEIGDFAFYNASNIKEMHIGAKQENVKLGKKWEPSSTGRSVDIEITWG